jgi:hypothetical protein
MANSAFQIPATPSPLPVANGGTGAGTAAGARANLGVPAISFHADRNSVNTSTLANGYNKITFTDDSTRGWDTHGYHDTSTGKFTPLVAGYYQITISLYVDTLTAGMYMAPAIYVNGYLRLFGSYHGYTGTSGISSMTAMVYLDGIDDYVEAYWYHNDSTNRAVHGSTTNTFFQGQLVGVVP